MVSGLINANPIVYEREERRVRSAPSNVDEYSVEPIDQQEIFDHIRDIKDPEHPYSLEELKVITEDAIEVDDKHSYVRVTFTPTVEHCSMATVIGLCLQVKLMRSLPARYKVDIRVAPGTHVTEASDSKNAILFQRMKMSATFYEKFHPYQCSERIHLQGVYEEGIPDCVLIMSFFCVPSTDTPAFQICQDHTVMGETEQETTLQLPEHGGHWQILVN